MTTDDYKTASQACDMLRAAVTEGIIEGVRRLHDHYERQIWIQAYAAAMTAGSTMPYCRADAAVEAFNSRFPNEQ